MKHLTFVIDSMAVVGGTQRVTSTIASGLAQRGYRVTILALHGRASAFPLHPGVRLSTLGDRAISLRSGFSQAVSALRLWLRQERPDVMILVESILANIAYPAAAGLKLRRVTWEHHHFHENLGQRSQFLARRVAAYLGQDVLTLTQYDARQWWANLPGARARIRSIANPLSFVQPVENPYQESSRTVLAMGRLTRQKGFDLLLDAWARIEPDVPDWSLRILGTGEDESSLREQAAQRNLVRWTLAPPTSHVEQEFVAAGVYALSSRHEGLPMVLMESQAYGVPAVAFDCPTGPADLLGPGGGILIPPDQTEAFADALKHLLLNPAARSNISIKAFENSPRYEVGLILDQWTAFINDSNAK